MPRPRFLVDSMLEKLARYLRCLGADAASDTRASTATLVERADREGRVFLTRNRHLEHHNLVPTLLVRLASEDTVEQVHQLLGAGWIDTQHLFTRCIRCNVELDEIERLSARPYVPARVYQAHQRFYRCPVCKSTFWHGSHVHNTCRKLRIPRPDVGPS